MIAYVLVEIDVDDEAGYEEYKQLAERSIAKYGGSYLIRGGTWEVLEGEWRPCRRVLLQFPDVDTARRWWASPEYSEARRVREATARARMLLLEGV